MKSLTTGSIETLRTLVENGADLLLKDASGKTVYDFVLAQDPSSLQPATKYIGEKYEEQRSWRLR